MLAITDYAVLFLLIFFVCNGWRSGVARSILHPLSFLISGIVGIIYYQVTKNLAISLVIGVTGSIIINLLFSLILTIWQKTANKNQPPSLASSLLGGVFNLLWNFSILFVFLILLTKLPSTNFLKLKDIQNDIAHSFIFSRLNNGVSKEIPSVHQFNHALNVLKDPSHSEKITSTKEYQALINDEDIQNILADETLKQQIHDGNVGKLITNPKIQMIFQSPQLLQKFANFEKLLWKENMETANNEKSPMPKVYDIGEQKRKSKTASRKLSAAGAKENGGTVKVYE